MQRLMASLPSGQFVLLAVDVDHSQASADAFLARFGPGMPVVFDPTGKIASQFHVDEMPTSILIDRQGHVRYVHKGFFDEQTPLYDSHISELINEK
jgi:peroxiredoxin